MPPTMMETVCACTAPLPPARVTPTASAAAITMRFIGCFLPRDRWVGLGSLQPLDNPFRTWLSPSLSGIIRHPSRDQTELQLEELAADAAEAATATDTNVDKEGSVIRSFTRRKPVRGPLPAYLPRERVVIPGPTECPCCGGLCVNWARPA